MNIYHIVNGSFIQSFALCRNSVFSLEWLCASLPHCTGLLLLFLLKSVRLCASEVCCLYPAPIGSGTGLAAKRNALPCWLRHISVSPRTGKCSVLLYGDLSPLFRVGLARVYGKREYSRRGIWCLQGLYTLCGGPTSNTELLLQVSENNAHPAPSTHP